MSDSHIGKPSAKKGKKGQIAWNKGIPMTEDMKKRISKKLTGRKLSKEIKAKLKGRKAWNKGKKIQSNTGTTHFIKGCIPWNKNKKMPEETKKKLSKAKTGIKASDETKRKMRETRKKLIAEGKITFLNVAKGKDHGMFGKKHTEETRLKISEKNKGRISPMKGLKGSKSPNWQGGLSFGEYGEEFNTQLKHLIKKRDNYICRICSIKVKNEYLHVHHIDYDKQNNDPINLISLCNKCHPKTNYNREKWKLFLIRLINSKLKAV